MPHLSIQKPCIWYGVLKTTNVWLFNYVANKKTKLCMKSTNAMFIIFWTLGKSGIFSSKF